VTIGCLTAFVIERARLLGYGDHADAMEECLAAPLKTMTKDQRRQTLSLAYEQAMKEFFSLPVKLRLVHSRD